MKKKYLYLLFNVTLFIVLLIIIKEKLLIKNAVLNSFSMWFNYLIPSIFPVIIIGKLLINNHFYEIINPSINKWFNQIFNFNGISLSLIIIGFIVGSPTAQIIYDDAYTKGLINKHTFDKLVITTSLINPFFFININTHLSLKIKIIFLVINLFLTIGLWLIIKIPTTSIYNNKYHSDNLIKIINSSFIIMINILGIIIFFNIILNLSNLLPNNIIKTIIISILEITSGINYLKTITNIKLRIILSIFLSSFLGLAINMQIKSIIKDQHLYNTHLITLIIKSLIITCIISMFT